MVSVDREAAAPTARAIDPNTTMSTSDHRVVAAVGVDEFLGPGEGPGPGRGGRGGVQGDDSPAGGGGCTTIAGHNWLRARQRSRARRVADQQTVRSSHDIAPILSTAFYCCEMSQIWREQLRRVRSRTLRPLGIVVPLVAGSVVAAVGCTSASTTDREPVGREPAPVVRLANLSQFGLRRVELVDERILVELQVPDESTFFERSPCWTLYAPNSTGPPVLQARIVEGSTEAEAMSASAFIPTDPENLDVGYECTANAVTGPALLSWPAELTALTDQALICYAISDRVQDGGPCVPVRIPT